MGKHLMSVLGKMEAFAGKVATLFVIGLVRMFQLNWLLKQELLWRSSSVLLFVESQHSSSKPLVLWLNGGPGCSSLGAGAMLELGPFRVNKDGKTIWHNPYSWNTAANILFLESPAGVGFSYSNKTSDYITGDKRTAADTYTFLVNWLERFPEYKTREFFLTGESYAGHYVPQLAQLILKNNKITNQTVINLKGIAVSFAFNYLLKNYYHFITSPAQSHFKAAATIVHGFQIGNAYVNIETQNQGVCDYVWSHALISDEIQQGIVSNCNFFSGGPVSDTCQTYEDQADAATGDIYAPLCSSSSIISEFDPCSSDYVFSYLNTPDVQ